MNDPARMARPDRERARQPAGRARVVTEASPLDGLGLSSVGRVLAFAAFWPKGAVGCPAYMSSRSISNTSRARGLYAAALFAILQGDYAEGKGLLQEA